MKHLVTLLLAAGLAAPAFAQAPDFATVDADMSGGVTLEELQAVMPDTSEELFNAADTDGSGDLSEEEFATIAGG
ncbi:EF-hand domain-containing protein [Chelativorans sp. Marseille-P2723]|uniref:EF-hand domain-containing protein n=1 Tax=Chelativorans sp. Marseille-P2723 TaxID=2709133 RepID=UPI00156D94DC|nr:EF-hand domain-containing protein [Chelativorans sp. Marseille-P2723]